MKMVKTNKKQVIIRWNLIRTKNYKNNMIIFKVNLLYVWPNHRKVQLIKMKKYYKNSMTWKHLNKDKRF